jgi:hypothetical protein
LLYCNYASGIDDDVSRVSDIADHALSNGSRTVYADYSYLGGGSGGKSSRPTTRPSSPSFNDHRSKLFP